MFRSNILYIYTDGSCLPKPRRGGIGIRYVYLDDNGEEQRIDHECFGYRGATNNQMELYACIKALKHVSKLDVNFQNFDIEVRTDSQYVTKHIYHAKFVWPKYKWHNRDGRPIDNTKIWKELLRCIVNIRKRVEFEWVKGHGKDEDNRAADRMAKESARSAVYEPLSVETVRRKITDKKIRIGSVKNAGQKIGIRIISSVYMSEQKVTKYRFEVISKGSKYFGEVDFVYSDLILKDAHSYFVSFNKDDKNPRILKILHEIEKEKSVEQT